jgi:metal-sulfur cluster biosynthetic enzyme
MSAPTRFDYTGEPALAPAVTRALKSVIDPEMALDVVELGLVYAVDIGKDEARVRITMTSAACPVTELIVDEVGHALRELLGPGVMVHVAVVWDPPWTPERMSDRARSAMGWD